MLQRRFEPPGWVLRSNSRSSSNPPVFGVAVLTDAGDTWTMSGLAPPTEAKRRAMKAQRQRDTKPELALRSVVFRRGLRYRVHRRAVPTVRRTVDFVFPSEKVAVEVRGCFWHACPQHATWPATNAEWWAEKLARNAERDAETEAQLRRAGWKLVVVWEHEDPERAASRIERSVKARRRRNAELRALSKS